MRDTSPLAGETVYGTFTALAEATDGSSQIALTIDARAAVAGVHEPNVDTAERGDGVGLTPGNYTAKLGRDRRQRRHPDGDHAVHRAVGAPGRAGAAGTAGSARPAGSPGATSGAQAEGQVQAGQARQDPVHGDVPEEPQQARDRAAGRVPAAASSSRSVMPRSTTEGRRSRCVSFVRSCARLMEGRRGVQPDREGIEPTRSRCR